MTSLAERRASSCRTSTRRTRRTTWPSSAAKASFSGLWVFKEDHTEARVLGALAKIAPEFLTLEAVCAGHPGGRVGLGAQGRVRAQGHERLDDARDQDHRGQRRDPVLLRDAQVVGDARGRDHPGHPRRQADGGREGLRARSATRTSRSSRPAPCGRSSNFDTCVKCTLCWIQCPDSCFDVTPDGLYDANMEACCGCGVCEAVCPVKDCITMVNEAAFDDNASQWEMWRKDKDALHGLDDREDPATRCTTVRSHGFRFRGQYEEELAQDARAGGRRSRSPAGIPGENADRRKTASEATDDGRRTMAGGAARQAPAARRRSTTRRCSSPGSEAVRRGPRPWPTSTSSPRIRSGPTTR